MAHLSKEYAESLFSLAMEGSDEEAFYSELRDVVALFDTEPEYYELLSSPGLTREERKGALAESIGDDMSEYVRSFLMLLCETGDMKLLPDCLEEYGRMLREAKHTSAVKVTSAAELTDEEKSRIYDKVVRLVGGECEIAYTVDPSLIGGAIIETENAVIDGSLRKSLQEMKEVIKK
ncbi:MAG: ATP synthase F1 subunit delta [Clostridia bacterium]|nr:ATP synthase F1 subunit delta [Clostridia bacterium]